MSICNNLDTYFIIKMAMFIRFTPSIYALYLLNKLIYNLLIKIT